MGNSWPQPHRARSVFPVQDSGRGIGAGARDRNHGGSQGWRSFFTVIPPTRTVVLCPRDAGLAPRHTIICLAEARALGFSSSWDNAGDEAPKDLWSTRCHAPSASHTRKDLSALTLHQLCGAQDSCRAFWVSSPSCPTFHFIPASTG